MATFPFFKTTRMPYFNSLLCFRAMVPRVSIETLLGMIGILLLVGRRQERWKTVPSLFLDFYCGWRGRRREGEREGGEGGGEGEERGRREGGKGGREEGGGGEGGEGGGKGGEGGEGGEGGKEGGKWKEWKVIDRRKERRKERRIEETLT